MKAGWNVCLVNYSDFNPLQSTSFHYNFPLFPLIQGKIEILEYWNRFWQATKMNSRLLNTSYPISPFILPWFAQFFIHSVIYQPVSSGQIYCSAEEKVIKQKQNTQTNTHPTQSFFLWDTSTLWFRFYKTKCTEGIKTILGQQQFFSTVFTNEFSTKVSSQLFCSFLHYIAKDAVVFVTILQDCSPLLTPNLQSKTQKRVLDSGLSDKYITSNLESHNSEFLRTKETEIQPQFYPLNLHLGSFTRFTLDTDWPVYWSGILLSPTLFCPFLRATATKEYSSTSQLKSKTSVKTFRNKNTVVTRGEAR